MQAKEEMQLQLRSHGSHVMSELNQKTQELHMLRRENAAMNTELAKIEDTRRREDQKLQLRKMVKEEIEAEANKTIRTQEEENGPGALSGSEK